MKTEYPLTRDLVLIGGGHAHALVLRQWGMKPLAGARVTVINPGPTAPYSGMLPGFVAGHYTRDDLDIDLIRLARFAGARVIDGAVTAIDPAARLITVPGRPPIAYDVASMDIGITSAMPDLPGFSAHGVPAKPLGAFATRWDDFRRTTNTPKVAVIGGGVAGAELAMAMRHALVQDGHAPTVTLVDRSKVLTALGDTARRRMMAALADQDITVVEDAQIAQVTPTGLELEDGAVIAADFVTGAAGARPHEWMSEIGVTMVDGFIAVDPHLQSSDPALFAVGDCAHMTQSPRPKAGVFAVRQAPVLFDNLRSALSGSPLRAYKPQADYLKLISLGGKSALAEKFGTAKAGSLLWRWKDRIDQAFMTRLNDLPMMEAAKLPQVRAQGLEDIAKPMCGGCGAKVGRSTLGDVLADLPGFNGDDAAILRTGGVDQVMTTDHLRAFVDDPVVMTRIAAVHALGDIWAMGAMPQAATVNLILPRMSAQMQRRTLSEITGAAQDVLRDAGAKIVGGHTSMGAELTIGFSLIGQCDTLPITLAGAQPGDALILTKPIGSGVIMAAEMAGKARGADVACALEIMQQGQSAASRILARAHAMTDVTGFGLAGHLTGICSASNVGATLRLTDIPLMDGALQLAKSGVTSSLFADNQAAAIGVSGPHGAAYDLLFDPQTAGGLLAAVSAADVADLVKMLNAAGYQAARVIGTITDQPGVVTVAG